MNTSSWIHEGPIILIAYSWIYRELDQEARARDVNKLIDISLTFQTEERAFFTSWVRFYSECKFFVIFAETTVNFLITVLDPLCPANRVAFWQRLRVELTTRFVDESCSSSRHATIRNTAAVKGRSAHLFKLTAQLIDSC